MAVKDFPACFGDFFGRLAKEYGTEIKAGKLGTRKLCRQGSKGEYSVIVDGYEESRPIDPQLLQKICRRLNINSGDFGVPEIL